MEYRGYKVTAEVTAYEMWTLNPDGTLGKIEEELSHSVTGYMFVNMATEDGEFITMSEDTVQGLRSIVDDMVDRHSMTEFMNFVGGAE